jgi:hypothetical protein
MIEEADRDGTVFDSSVFAGFVLALIPASAARQVTARSTSMSS